MEQQKEIETSFDVMLCVAELLFYPHRPTMKLLKIINTVLKGEATGQAAHTAGAYPGFRGIKRLGIFLLPPEWDASPLQGSPPALCRRYPFLHLGGERHYESKVSCPRTQHKWPRPGLEIGPLDPESGALTIRPLHLPKILYYLYFNTGLVWGIDCQFFYRVFTFVWIDV